MQIAGFMKSTVTALAIRRPIAASFSLRSGTQAVTTVARQSRISALASCSSTSLFSTSSSGSSFEAPTPPKSKGLPVYDDVDISPAENKFLVSSQRNADPNAVFVVNGSSRGIGLQFVKSLVDRTQGTILACCRSPESADKLNDYISSSPEASQRVKTIRLDVEDQTSIDAAAEKIKTSYNRVDCLFNVAGILGDGKSTPGPERSLSKMDRDWVEKTMAVNVIGPVMLSKALAPMMISKKRGKKSSTGEERAQSVIVNLSARVGSISDNELGGWYSYRFSKTALNQATRTMAHELKRQGTWTIALHPGTTDTDLSKPFQRNVQEGRLFPVDFTVGRLLDVVDCMEDKHTGGLYDWSGTALPF